MHAHLAGRSIRALARICLAHLVRLQHGDSRRHWRGQPVPDPTRHLDQELPPHPAPERSGNRRRKGTLSPAEFAAAVAVSTRAFSQLAKTHDEFVRNETAARLNEHGKAKTFKIGDKVKVRVPPTALQMEETGRRVERLSQTAYAATDDVTKRRYERVISKQPVALPRPESQNQCQRSIQPSI
jgi:hypothetical protein